MTLQPYAAVPVPGSHFLWLWLVLRHSLLRAASILQVNENEIRQEKDNQDLYAAALEESQRSQHVTDSTGPVRSKSSIRRRGSLEVSRRQLVQSVVGYHVAGLSCCWQLEPTGTHCGQHLCIMVAGPSHTAVCQ